MLRPIKFKDLYNQKYLKMKLRFEAQLLYQSKGSLDRLRFLNYGTTRLHMCLNIHHLKVEKVS